MERNFYTDDFERLIRQKADQYKMYPSDQVWKGVYKSLHGRRRWRWAGLAILLLSIGLYTGNWYLTGKPAAKLANNMQSSLTAADDFQPSSAVQQRENSTTASSIKRNTSSSRRQQAASGFTTNVYSNENSLIITNEATNPGTQSMINAAADDDDQNTIAEKTDTEKPADTKASTEQSLSTENTLSKFADASSESVLKENKEQSINWLEEYAVFQLAPSKAQRFGLSLHFSPTVNYRKLSGTNYYTAEVKTIPLSPNIIGDVDQYVKHRPALGFEVGSPGTELEFAL